MYYCHEHKVIREETSGYYGQPEVRIECDIKCDVPGGGHEGDHFDETVGVYWRPAN